jgi:hypothetical protein
MKYDYNTLIEFCKEHNVTLLIDYSSLKSVNSFTIIEGKCLNLSCNFNFKKEFRCFIKTNGYCIECTKLNAKQKLKTTWLEKYGVEHISKLEHFKNKVKQTSLAKYGNECSLNNVSVKEKSKQTCLEKYGVENYSQTKEFQEKSKNTNLNKYGVEHHSQTQNFKDQYKATSLEKYGVEHHSQTQNFKDQYKATCLEKYGVDSYNKTDEFKNKFKETFISKYGVDSPFKIEEVVEKGKQTCLEKYGVQYYSQSQKIQEQIKETSLHKYGVEHYTQTQEFKERYKATCLEKYGVENSSQNTEIMEKIIKNAYKLKEYVFPSGKIEKVQGDEPYALKELIENNIDENDIITGIKNVPTIWYNDVNGKKHRHYVDIFIPSQNRCIEVKSTWTEKININNIFLKQNAAKEVGYKYEIWVYDSKKNKVNCYK